MLQVFLSASIPDPKRNPRYFETADVIAIRDAVRALATAVVSRGRLVWGGHPAITPVIRLIAESLGVALKKHMIIYQPEFFFQYFPPDNHYFDQIIVVPGVPGGRENNLREMRRRMFSDHEFDFGFFIGGMEGVEDEYYMLREMQPETRLVPVATSGAAAKFIFEREQRNFDPRLASSYAYLSLFEEILSR